MTAASRQRGLKRCGTLLIVATFSILTTMHTARSGAVLDRVRHDGLVRCSAEEVPVLAVRQTDGGIRGLAVDLCRAVAIAVLGREGRIAFSIDAPLVDADLSFSDRAAVSTGLTAGPVIFANPLSVLVPLASPVHAPRDLAGQTVCLMIGSPEQSALETAVGHLGIGVVRLAFEEDVEMHDAYAVGRCGAMIGTAAELGEMRGPMGINRLTSRILTEPLALAPVVVVTAETDGDWTRLVSWLMRKLLNDRGEGSAGSSTTPGGVRRGWQREVGSVLGGYRAMLLRADGHGAATDAGGSERAAKIP